MGIINNIHRNLIYELNTRMNIPVIRDYENGPEPQGSYVAVGISSMTKLGRNSTNYNDIGTTLNERTKQDYNVEISFSVYGEDAYDRAFEIQTYLSSTSLRDALSTEACLSITDGMSVQRVPELRDTGFIDKSVFSIVALVGFESEYEVDWFDTIRWEGTFYNQACEKVLHVDGYVNILEWYNTRDAINAWINATDLLYELVHVKLPDKFQVSSFG